MSVFSEFNSCESCGGDDTMTYKDQEIYLDDGDGTTADLLFKYCEVCGHIDQDSVELG